ncbi:MAG: right-handed parallel beta-helix repeat-containing protein [Kiritimatiellae bacterium]|nr:right-handed parallel beta-helix repeat-containing protein [Kiritimatiellia bacterium]
MRRVGVRIAVLLTLAPLLGCGADYYVDSSAGADDAAGTVPSAPYRSLAKLASLRLEPGDTVHFKRGSVFRGALRFAGNGLEGEPIRLAAYGEGARPEFRGSVCPAGWQSHRGELYKTALPREQIVGDRTVNGVFACSDNGLPVRLRPAKGRLPEAPGRYAYDWDAETLYVMTPDGKPPATHRLEVAVLSPILALEGRSWLEFEDLAFAFGNRGHIRIERCRDLLFRRCASLFQGMSNNNVYLGEASRRVQFIECFLYESYSNGLTMRDGTTQCVVRGCTIVKIAGHNDCVDCHAGPTVDGKRTQLAGDANVFEGNVFGLCNENAIDITSGDHHVLRGNICYQTGQAAILIGHDADHILVENNICFESKRQGIKVGGTKEEGSRGANRVIGNLCYANARSGILVEMNDTKVFNNTIVNSAERDGLIVMKEGFGSELRNNLIAALEPPKRDGVLCMEFSGGSPTLFNVKFSHHLFYDASRPDGLLITSDYRQVPLEEYPWKYGTGESLMHADPKFRDPAADRFFLAPDSPAVDAGTDVGLPFKGKAPDIGWKELGGEAAAPAYPPFLIGDGRNDEAEVLYLWGGRATE